MSLHDKSINEIAGTYYQEWLIQLGLCFWLIESIILYALGASLLRAILLPPALGFAVSLAACFWSLVRPQGKS